MSGAATDCICVARPDSFAGLFRAAWQFADGLASLDHLQALAEGLCGLCVRGWSGDTPRPLAEELRVLQSLWRRREELRVRAERLSKRIVVRPEAADAGAPGSRYARTVPPTT